MKLKHIEATLATLVLLICFFEPISMASLYYSKDEFAYNFSNEFRSHGMHFDFIIHYFIPTAVEYLSIYFSFLWIATLKPDQLVAEGRFKRALLFLLPGFLLTWIALIIVKWLREPYGSNIILRAAFEEFRGAVHVYSLIVIYQAVKHSVIWYFTKKRVNIIPKTKNLLIDIAWFVVAMCVLLALTMVFHVKDYIGFFVVLVIPGTYLVYMIYQYKLLPRYDGQLKNRRIWFSFIAVSLLVDFFFIGAYVARGTSNVMIGIAIFLLCWLAQQVLILPLSYAVYTHRKNNEAELTGLRTDLGTSNANLQFLRSQINPHFLFNALNTLYGTALIEKADKTGEGIQKLGDMMRFMLHENTQDKIALSRELDYLKNYIDLQNLRLATSPDIEVDVDIADIVDYHQIAPMLLIPFVENAYKHGISLRERSWINISLFMKESDLHLDVHNSIHPERENDPEKNRSGIGLENVKQRLGLLYPNQHELVIRQNSKEFFVHLTIKLS